MKYTFSDKSIYNHNELTPAKVEKWYSRQQRSWVVELQDENGYQIGEAYYCHSKQEAETEVNRIKKEYNLG